ncbi:hypothetical protein LTR62_000046 [Meristemomyces frigidus]|uniref:Nucleoprotein TPR/MLP1 domain-containing protein n=1 Tax=Meristemomyces frigidus TaxID=1508187 RepID=A0AAN7YKZ2_9PEZI|nr:hypothetical protein LTR62_000046 [Meristemomyces frigidus]
MVRTRAKAADPMAIDLPYLSTTYDVSETDIQTLLDSPTNELIRQFLASVTTKAQDFDALQTEKLKVDVELENTVRTFESKIKAQKSQVTKHAKEVEELRIKLNEAESARESLASELNTLRSSTSGSSAETSTLKQRIETLELANRDALALVESKSAEKDGLATELSEQHGKLLTIRREVGLLEEQNQSLENAASTQKFKEQSLQQEIDLLKRNNEWHSNELQTRNQEHAKFRKERNARIASLQRELEDGNANVDALKRTETTLRQRLEDLQGKADEAFARIASLQEEAARKEQDFRNGIDATKRLADLQAQNAATHKARLQDVQTQVDQIKEDAAEEIGRLQAEIETERGDKEQAERKVAELELEVERMEQLPRASRPGTPRRNGGLDPQTPSQIGSRAGSPSAMPGSLRKTVNGLSFTQVYSQMIEAQEDLAREQQRTQKLSETLDEVVHDIEQRGPEMIEARQDQERLEQEVLNFSNLLDEANETRESAIKEAQQWQTEAVAAAREGDVLRQQLRDLSTQIKMLLVDIQSRDEGLGEMSAQERLELERAARGETADGELERMTDTGRLIAERLVIFRNVDDMQRKYQQMLQLTHVLGERLEGDEAQAKERQTAAYASENEELKSKVQRLQDELQATVTQIDSYMKERDMFRRMLAHRGQLPAGDGEMQAMFGQSVSPATPSRGNGAMEPPTPRSKDVEDLNKLLREQQTFFDQYRNETVTDRRTLKEQVDSLAREKGTLQADLARLQSQLELASGRYEMLQGNMNSVRAENQELQKRSQQLAEQAAKQDLRTQQVAEDLIEARSLADSLRHENANAKAEKDLWRRIESRLTEDNKNLMDERSRLNKHVADLQNLQNERELADSESRRRLQTRTETLETELIDVKKKLERELDENRKAGLRREYEEGQNRTRIDDLVKSLGNIREELVAAKTVRDQLSSRVEEMKIELRSAEEKVVALQPRPTPRSTSAVHNGADEAEEELSDEQRLGVEVSDLKRDLELAKNELESVRQQAEQYKSISQATEEELASMNETSEQYREDMDQQLAEKAARIQELEQRVHDITAELTTTNNEVSELRTKAEQGSRALEEQRADTEAELARLRDDADRYAEEKILMREDLKAQAEIAQQAQQSYEDELLKHAEAAKSLQQIRKEYNELRTEVAGVRAEAEAARAGLESGKDSWDEQRGRFERELEELGRRRSDVDEQNKLLHQQMEVFSSELKALRQGRAQPEGHEAAAAGSPGRVSSDGNLQEVIRYLRREKEIVDVQYELSMQEAKRLQQQLEYANGQLESVRQSLADERRAGAEKEATESSTNRLQQTINELNLYRESATTLRNEARMAREKLGSKAAELERMAAQLEPLQIRVGELEGDVEGKDGEIKLLQSDRDHWRERTQNIISKYDRVDPAELESIKTQLQSAQAEKQRLESALGEVKAEIGNEAQKAKEAAEAEMGRVKEKTKETLDKFRDQAKEQNRKQTERIKAANEEREKVAAELEVTRTQLADAQQLLAEKGEEGEVDEGLAEGFQKKFEEAEAQIAALQGRVQELEAQLEAAQQQQGRVRDLETQLEAAQQQSDGSTRMDASAINGPADGEVLEKLKQDLATAQQEVETLRTHASKASPTAAQEYATTSDATMAEDTDKSIAQQVQEACNTLRAEMEVQHELALKQKEEYVQTRVEGMKTQLNTKLREGREKFRQEILNEHAAELQKLRNEHEKSIGELNAAHQVEMERLKADTAREVQKAGEAKTTTMDTSVSDTTNAEASATAQIIKPDEGADLSELELTSEQMVKLIQTNARAKTLFSNSIQKAVIRETTKLEESVREKEAEIQKLNDAIKEKDEEIEKLNEASKAKDEEIARIREELATTVNANLVPTAAIDTSTNDEKIAELTKKLEDAEKEKQIAVSKAVNQADLKGRLHVSLKEASMAKFKVVEEAAKQTPDRAVKEVYDLALKAKPPPKAPAPAPVSAGSAKPAEAVAAAASQVSADPTTDTDETAAEATKLKARQDRFGLAATPTPSTGTSAQPSQPLSQPARRPSAPAGPGGHASPNPHATAFTPNYARSDIGTGPSAFRGALSNIPRGGMGSGLPRPGAGGNANRGGGFVGGNSISIQGAAARGGSVQQSALPQPGSAGNWGGRGGSHAAGQKRPFEGDGSGGDGKRTRGGGGQGGAGA